MKGAEALLVVETGLSYDLKVKMPTYVSHGVREHWVINAIAHMTMVHRQQAGNDCARKVEFPPTERLIPSLAPQLALSLDERDLD